MTTETLTPVALPLEVQPAPVETVTPILPSEALALGRLLRPKRMRGGLFRGGDRACAVGAMALGFGMPDPGRAPRTQAARDAVYDFVAEHFPKPFKGDAWVQHIWESNDAGYSDHDIALSMKALGL